MLNNMLGGLKAKLIGLGLLLVVGAFLWLAIEIKIKDARLNAMANEIASLKTENSNYAAKEKANVAASKQKAELEKTIEKISANKDVGAEDRANLTYVPNDAVLMQLQSDPF